MTKQMLKTLFAQYRLYFYLAALVAVLGACGYALHKAYSLGETKGASRVQLAWDTETKSEQQQSIKLLEGALAKAQQQAKEDAAQARRDMDAALKASEQRQAQRIEAATRQASIEAATRAQGSAYTDPRCKLDPKTAAQLNGALKK